MWMVLPMLRFVPFCKCNWTRKCIRVATRACFELYYKYNETSLISRDQCAEYVENSNIKISDLLDVASRIAFF